MSKSGKHHLNTNHISAGIPRTDFWKLVQASQRTIIFFTELVIWEGVDAWKYNYSDTNLTWEDARKYCQKSFTDLVAIQNQEEVNHLNQILPRNPTYYWIGIRKIAGVWTWVGTNKSLDKKAENWAEGEPTSGGEDCVEIYIKRQKEAGKWNNHSCNKLKAAICYLASCKPNSCNHRGECVETVGDYKCLCDEGFYGSQCESVKQCASLSAPVQAKMLCSHPLGNFSFNSTCDFHCMAGFTLQGSQSLQCTAAGQWTAETPSCEGKGLSTIHHHCKVWKSGDSRERIHELLSPLQRFRLQISIRFLFVSAVKCGNLEILEKGYMNCSHPFRDFGYKSVCTFSCDKGFHLGGLDSIQCGTSGQWNGQKPTCEVYIFDKIWEPQKATVATVGTAFALLLLSFVVWGIIHRYRKAKQEKNPLAR
ncbi:L-selectin-like [Hypanus sabinus]|uniref:L-selectin-like n=1 Tax=Hypanus sabinus TaxID=79690 RepID=UPI0028C39657|nr:L-selectin-like [Hypanus sabinus]